MYAVAVKSLCEFGAKSGDLDLRFTPSPTAQQGIAGHLIVGARRGPDYQREVMLEGRYRHLLVRGRADGFDRAGQRLEEFKTHRGDLERMPANQRGHHWAQLKVYGALLCAARGFAEIDLGLVYFDIKSGRETVFDEHYTAAALQRFFEDLGSAFLGWAEQEIAHRGNRNRYLRGVSFPLRGLRTGQRQLAESVYRTALADAVVMIQAPTGIGKTLGTLFPLLKAAPRQKLDKILFLVAKTSGRELALDAMRTLLTAQDPGVVRVLELVSKADACVYPGRSCDGASCPLAKGFYDRLPAARAAAVNLPLLDRAAVQGSARRFQVCPYFLTQELVRWCDVIIGDYTYFFDSSAILQGLVAQNRWRVGVLVDEAHNLVARARDMYSATLDPQVLDAALRYAASGLAAPLREVLNAWPAESADGADEYQVFSVIPDTWVAVLQRATSAIADEVARDASSVDESVMTFYFDALRFCRLADSFGSHSLFDAVRVATRVAVRVPTHSGARLRLCIRNVNPAPFLSARFAQSATAVLFSATLSPADFYRRLLGLPQKAAWLSVDSPFAAEQLEVRIERRISTRFRDRQGSLRPIADLMARRYLAVPGNYLAFFSSFAYLEAALDSFQRRCPDVPVWAQEPGMAADARDGFLARFTPQSRGIGFAVLGGVFAEGVDLPGARLIGAFIATLGLPQVNAVNAEIERRMDVLFDQGYEYTYLYPGLQKVVQAAGRVIRTLTDRGSVILMDDRYATPRVRELLPAWWRVQCS